MKGVMTSLSSESVLLSVSTAHIENHQNRGKFKLGEVWGRETALARDGRARHYMMAAEMENRAGTRNVAEAI